MNEDYKCGLMDGHHGWEEDMESDRWWMEQDREEEWGLTMEGEE